METFEAEVITTEPESTPITIEVVALDQGLPEESVIQDEFVVPQTPEDQFSEDLITDQTGQCDELCSTDELDELDEEPTTIIIPTPESTTPTTAPESTPITIEVIVVPEDEFEITQTQEDQFPDPFVIGQCEEGDPVFPIPPNVDPGVYRDEFCSRDELDGEPTTTTTPESTTTNTTPNTTPEITTEVQQPVTAPELAQTGGSEALLAALGLALAIAGQRLINLAKRLPNKTI